MSEPKLYRSYVTPQSLYHKIDEGSPVTVNGTPMVQFGPYIVPAAGWTASKAEALQAAAAELEARALLCNAEAGKLRQEAAHALANG